MGDCDAYRAGQTPKHYICSNYEDREQVSDRDMESCRATCRGTPGCTVVQWQGLIENDYSADKDGQCFLYSKCDDSDIDFYESEKSANYCMDISQCDASVLDLLV